MTWRCRNSVRKRRPDPPGERKSGRAELLRQAGACRFHAVGRGQGLQSLQWKPTRHCLGKKSRRCRQGGGPGRRGGVGAIFLGPCRGLRPLVDGASGRVAESPHGMGRKVPWPCNCRLAPSSVLIPPNKWHTRCIREWVCGIPAKWNVSRRHSIVEPRATAREQPTRSLRDSSFSRWWCPTRAGK